MASHAESCRDRAEHYRRLAGLISDEATHRILLAMAHELDGDAGAAGRAPRAEPVPQGLS